MKSVFGWATRQRVLGTAILALGSSLGLVVSVHAATNCFGLNDADCQAVSAADANIAKETSFNFGIDAAVHVQAPGQDQQFTIKGTGALAFDPNSLSMSNASSTDFLHSFKGTVHIEVASAVTQPSSSGIGQDTLSTNAQADLIVVDGIAYARTPDPSGQPGQWHATPFNALTQSVSQSFNTSPSNPALALLRQPDVMQTLAAIPNIPGFITAKNTGNAPTLEGQRQLELAYTVDLQTLLTSNTIVPLLKDFIAAGNNSNPAAIDDNQAAGAGKLLAGAIEGTTIKVTRWIGTTDKFYHKLALDALLKFDARAFGGPGTTTVNTQFSIILTQVGQPVTVTAPIPPPAGADALLLATIPPDDAVIPDTALSRFAGIPEGVTGNGQGPGTFPYLGNPSAPVKMMQFSSYSCSACLDYYNAVVVNLLPAIRAGQVQYIFVPVTLTGEYDPTSETAAALCALDQGRYWEMHDTLFNWRSRYESAAADPHRLEVAALKLGLNPDKFLSCVSSQAIRARIGADDDYFDTLGFFDTPSVAINGKPLDTPPDLNQIYQMIANSQTETTPQAGTPTFSTPAPFLGPTPTVSDNNQAGPLT